MDKNWISAKEKDLTDKIEEVFQSFQKFILSLQCPEENKMEVIEAMKANNNEETSEFFWKFLKLSYYAPITAEELISVYFGRGGRTWEELIAIRAQIHRLLDYEPVHMKGDLIITDPCYYVRERKDGTHSPTIDDFLSEEEIDIINNDPVACVTNKTIAEKLNKSKEATKKWEETHDDFDMLSKGKHEQLGFSDFLIANTIYGDWSCHTLDENDNILGSFFADAGTVAVAYLDEVKAYNPDANLALVLSCSTVIKNFDGEIQIKFERDDPYAVEYSFTDYHAVIIGNGVNSITGEPIHFHSAPYGI